MFGPDFFLEIGKLFVQQVENSNWTPLVSVLLEGAVGCGKTALASRLAMSSGFPYVKLISPENMIGLPPCVCLPCL